MHILEKVTAYYTEPHHFKAGIETLRKLALQTGLAETYKWNFPTYTLAGKNVLAICKFKKHFGIWFFNGVFLEDKNTVLENAQEGKTQAMRHWRFYNNEDIDVKFVLAYMNEAVENQKNGKVFKPNKNQEKQIVVSQLLLEALEQQSLIKSAFDKLSSSKQSAYAAYIEDAKQESTKQRRLKKILPMIANGLGLNDKYR